MWRHEPTISDYPGDSSPGRWTFGLCEIGRILGRLFPVTNLNRNDLGLLGRDLRPSDSHSAPSRPSPGRDFSIAIAGWEPRGRCAGSRFGGGPVSVAERERR